MQHYNIGRRRSSSSSLSYQFASSYKIAATAISTTLLTLMSVTVFIVTAILLVSTTPMISVVDAASPAGYGSTSILTAADVTIISHDITLAFGLTASYGMNCNPCNNGDMIGAMVRLAVHDAMGGGGPNGLGGGNGCNDSSFDLSEFKGVLPIYRILAAKYSKKISIADLWALGATVAIQHASTLATGAITGTTGTPPATPGALLLPFRYGRRDASNCQGSDQPFLKTFVPGIDWPTLFSIFGTRFGMSVQETVAFLGIHSLGRFNVSGIIGGTTMYQSSLTNVYYAQPNSQSWTRNTASSIAIWQSTSGTSMLDMDVVALFGGITNGVCTQFNSFASCDQNRAQGNGEPAASWVRYSASMNRWYPSFGSAWIKMAEMNWASLLALPGSPLPFYNETIITSTGGDAAAATNATGLPFIQTYTNAFYTGLGIATCAGFVLISACWWWYKARAAKGRSILCCCSCSQVCCTSDRKCKNIKCTTTASPKQCTTAVDIKTNTFSPINSSTRSLACPSTHPQTYTSPCVPPLPIRSPTTHGHNGIRSPITQSHRGMGIALPIIKYHPQHERKRSQGGGVHLENMRKYEFDNVVAHERTPISPSRPGHVTCPRRFVDDHV